MGNPFATDVAQVDEEAEAGARRQVSSPSLTEQDQILVHLFGSTVAKGEKPNSTLEAAYQEIQSRHGTTLPQLASSG